MKPEISRTALERAYNAETILKAIVALTEDDRCHVGPAVLNQLAILGVDCVSDVVGLITDHG